MFQGLLLDLILDADAHLVSIKKGDNVVIKDASECIRL